MIHGFIIVYDDGEGYVNPMTHDADCPGAVCGSGKGDPVAWFLRRSEARKAIRISTRFAALQRELGKPFNDDFLGDFLKRIKVMPLKGGPREA